MHLCAQSVRKRFHDNDASDGGEDPFNAVLQVHIYQRKSIARSTLISFFFVSHSSIKYSDSFFLLLTKTNKTVMRYIYISPREQKKVGESMKYCIVHCPLPLQPTPNLIQNASLRRNNKYVLYSFLISRQFVAVQQWNEIGTSFLTN